MKIVIKQNKEEKTFELKKLSAAAYAKQLEVRELFDKKNTEDEQDFTLDEFYQFADSIVLAFDNQFTRAELLDSVDLCDFITYPALIAQAISEQTNKKVEELVKNL